MRLRTIKEQAIWNIKNQPYFRTLKELMEDIKELCKDIKKEIKQE